MRDRTHLYPVSSLVVDTAPADQLAEVMDDGPGRPGHLAEEAGLFAVEAGHLQQKQSGILHNIHSQLYIGYNDRLEEKQNEEIPVGPICLINSILTVRNTNNQLNSQVGRHRHRQGDKALDCIFTKSH